MKTYTKKEIALIENCSLSTIEKDLNFLDIKPIKKGDRGLKLYSDRDYQLISKLRQHCSRGKIRETFLSPTPVQIIPKNQPLKEIEPEQTEDRRANYLASDRKIDPLADLEMLQRIADNKWCLPTKRLAAIIGIRPQTLLANSPYNHCGFVCVKYYPCNGTYLWKITNVGGITKTIEES